MKNWFLDLSISKKILALALVSSLLIVLVGFIGYHFTTKASSEMTTMYKDRLLPVEWLGQCMRHAHANRANIFNLILEHDENKQQEIVNDINIRGKGFLDLIADYEKTKLDKFEVENLVKLKQALAEYKKDRIRIADLALKGDRKEAYLYFVENKRSFDDFTNVLRDLIKYNEKVAHEINEQNHEEAKKLRC